MQIVTPKYRYDSSYLTSVRITGSYDGKLNLSYWSVYTIGVSVTLKITETSMVTVIYDRLKLPAYV